MPRSAASILREARQRARQSQSEVARRAGVAQPVISAYESGRREPGVRMLGRLVEATGHRLVLDIVPTPDLVLGLPDTTMGRRLRRHRRTITEIALRRGASNVRVFGSVARGEDSETSDVDMLVDLDPSVGLVSLAGLERELSELLGVDVDVVPADALKPRVRSRVLAQAVPL